MKRKRYRPALRIASTRVPSALSNGLKKVKSCFPTMPSGSEYFQQVTIHGKSRWIARIPNNLMLALQVWLTVCMEDLWFTGSHQRTKIWRRIANYRRLILKKLGTIFVPCKLENIL